MKSIVIGLATVLLLIAAVALGAQKQDQVERQLKAAMNKELVDGNLKAAIDEYKKVADSGIRPLAAQALIHLAECYQKLGDAEAQKVYQRIVREFGDQKAEVALAQARLGGTTVGDTKRDRTVWTGPGVIGVSRVSPDGRFITGVDQNGSLYVHDIGANVNRVLTPPAPNYSQWADLATISRDGKQVIYVWRDDKTLRLRIADLQRSGFPEPRQFYLADNDVRVFWTVDWSPDGKWIAAAVLRKDGTGQIALIAVADGSFKVLKSIMDLNVPQAIFFSPDSRYIAYDLPATGTSQQRDVFVLTIDGSRQIPAVVHSANDAVMGWSPDGSRLLFSSDRRGSVDLWALPFTNGKVQGSPELLKSDIGPSSSLGMMDSGALYVYKRISTRDITIAPIDLDAGKLLGPPVSFTQGFLENPGPAYWSPDGKYLAYQVNSCNQGCIAIRSVATGQVRRLATNLTNARAVSWSPDGRSLLTKGKDLKGRDGIFQIDVQSGEATTVILRDGLTTLAQWSQDGKKVYFNPSGVLVERDLASGAERDIYRDEGWRNGSLSPDGQYFAVTRTDPSTKAASLLLVPVAGGKPRELVRLTQSESAAAVNVWTPDSSALIITKDTGARIELWLVPVTGGMTRKLDVDREIWSGGSSELLPGFSLSPDGRSIAFQMGKTTSEVRALEDFLPAPAAKK